MTRRCPPRKRSTEISSVTDNETEKMQKIVLRKDKKLINQTGFVIDISIDKYQDNIYIVGIEQLLLIKIAGNL